MKQTVTESMFIDSFCGGYKDNFSYEGKKALYEYLTQLEDDCGIELELDPAYWNTNGWQGDWWWQFDYLGEPFILSGGLFTNFITIALDVDKLNDEDETNDVKLSFGGEYV